MPDPRAVRAFLDETHTEKSVRVAEFAASTIAQFGEPKDDDTCRKQARELMGEIGQAGWFAPIRDNDLRLCCLTREALAANSPLADAVFALQALGSVPIALGGTKDVKELWLSQIYEGKAMAAFAMTEPGAGSDVSSMRTTARKDGDHYILNGRKTLISNAGIADVYTVFASTDQEKGNKGITAFAVPAQSRGLEFAKAQIMSAPHPLGEIVFQDCKVPVTCRLGGEGEGFKLGMTTLDRLRCTVAAAACGMAERALQEATGHALNRQQFGKPLTDFQMIQQKLARMATDLTAARLLTYRAAWEKDGGAERVSQESAMAKAFATEAAQRIVDDAVQICGGRGCLADHPVDRLYRSVRSLRIYEGTTEIQNLIIASHHIKAAKGSK